MLVFDFVFVGKFFCPKFAIKRPKVIVRSFFAETFPSESFRFECITLVVVKGSVNIGKTSKSVVLKCSGGER